MPVIKRYINYHQLFQCPAKCLQEQRKKQEQQQIAEQLLQQLAKEIQQLLAKQQQKQRVKYLQHKLTKRKRKQLAKQRRLQREKHKQEQRAKQQEEERAQQQQEERAQQQQEQHAKQQQERREKQQLQQLSSVNECQDNQNVIDPQIQDDVTFKQRPKVEVLQILRELDNEEDHELIGLDLHNLSLVDAMRMFTLFLSVAETVYKDSGYSEQMRFISVITGQGIHSKNGPVIKPEVEDHLTEHDYTFSWTNKGMVVIDLQKQKQQQQEQLAKQQQEQCAKLQQLQHAKQQRKQFADQRRKQLDKKQQQLFKQQKRKLSKQQQEELAEEQLLEWEYLDLDQENLLWLDEELDYEEHEKDNVQKQLDLHDLSLVDAVQKFKWFLSEAERAYKNSNLSCKKRFVNVITGWGRHSPNGALIKPRVEKYLLEHAYKFIWTNKGTVMIDLMS